MSTKEEKDLAVLDAAQNNIVTLVAIARQSIALRKENEELKAKIETLLKNNPSLIDDEKSCIISLTDTYGTLYVISGEIINSNGCYITFVNWTKQIGNAAKFNYIKAVNWIDFRYGSDPLFNHNAKYSVLDAETLQPLYERVGSRAIKFPKKENKPLQPKPDYWY